jgi:hypothetical protein
MSHSQPAIPETRPLEMDTAQLPSSDALGGELQVRGRTAASELASNIQASGEDRKTLRMRERLNLVIKPQSLGLKQLTNPQDVDDIEVEYVFPYSTMPCLVSCYPLTQISCFKHCLRARNRSRSRQDLDGLENEGQLASG